MQFFSFTFTFFFFPTTHMFLSKFTNTQYLRIATKPSKARHSLYRRSQKSQSITSHIRVIQVTIVIISFNYLLLRFWYVRRCGRSASLWPLLVFASSSPTENNSFYSLHVEAFKISICISLHYCFLLFLFLLRF